MTDQLTGLASPFKVFGRTVNGFWVGGVKTAAGVDKVEQDLIQLLSVRFGERVMLRGYGAGAHRSLQAPNDKTTQTVVHHDIEVALRQFLPEVRLVSPVRVEGRGEEIDIVVDYMASPFDVVRRLQLGLARPA